jgi:DNA ligase (NAD+)
MPKRWVELMIKAAQGSLNTLSDWRSGRLREPAMAEKAGAPNIGATIQDGIDAMGAVIDKMLANGVTVKDAVQVASDLAADKPGNSVCISGKLHSGKKKADYDAPLRLAGYKLVDDVIKGLTYLVLADPASASSKAAKARKLGVAVISEEELISLTIDDKSLSPVTITP